LAVFIPGQALDVQRCQVQEILIEEDPTAAIILESFVDKLVSKFAQKNKENISVFLVVLHDSSSLYLSYEKYHHHGCFRP